ncbi:MAG: hypothetical protein P9L99_20265 [Candidatus Lernaella stagnicola]|nr:hypothetical protein [Candidatus Lernaella stagnicola]
MANTPSDQESCVLSDYGVITSLHSTRPGKTIDTYKELRGRYGEYKERVSETLGRYETKNKKRVSPKHKAEFEKLYNPLFYYMWGPFDLCSISCVDAFSLAPQLHVPLSGSIQIAMQAVPDFTKATQTPRESRSSRTNPWFFAPDKLLAELGCGDDKNGDNSSRVKWPLFAFCKLKVNPILTLVLGASIVREAILATREQVKPQSEDNNDDLRCCVLEPLGWNEITLLVFGKDYSQMVSSILSIRDTTLGELLSKKPESIKTLRKNPVLLRLLDDEELKKPENGAKLEIALREMSLYAASWTTLGLHIGVFTDVLERNKKGENAEQIARHVKNVYSIEGRVVPDIGLGILPGYFGDTISDAEDIRKEMLGEKANEENADKKTSVGTSNGDSEQKRRYVSRPGHTDLVWRTGKGFEDDGRAVSTIDFIVDFVRLTHDVELSLPLSKHVTSLGVPVQYNEAEEKESDRLCLDLESLQMGPLYRGEKTLSKDEIKPKTAARVLQLPRHLRSEIESLIAVYDMIVKDEVLYDTIVDLGPPLVLLINWLSHLGAAIREEDGATNRTSRQWEDVVADLARCVQSFRQALNNRLNASPPFSEVSDFTLEFKGGIQHLLTGIDGLFASGLVATTRKCKEVKKPYVELPGFTVIGEKRTGVLLSSRIGAVTQKNMIEMMQPETYPYEMHESFHHSLRQLDGMRPVFEIITIYKKIAKRLMETFIAGHSESLVAQLGDLFEEIAADQMCRDLVFSSDEKGDELYKKWFGVYYANTVNYGPGLESNNDYRCQLVVRYLLSLRQQPTTAAFNSPIALKKHYGEEMEACGGWLLGDPFLESLAGGDAKNWNQVWQCFDNLACAEVDLAIGEFGDKIVESLEQIAEWSLKLKQLHGDAKINQRYPGFVEFLFAVRRALWGGHCRTKKHYGSGIDFTKNIVSAFDRSAGKNKHEAGVFYSRYVLSEYLTHVLSESTLAVVERKRTDGTFDFKKGNPPLVVDPAGGLYAAEPGTRRKYFGAAIVSIFSLWDLGLFVKYERLRETLEYLDDYA